MSGPERRDAWRPVLEGEIKRWSAMFCEQLAAELLDDLVYEVEFDSKMYQVEGELLENIERYIHVAVAVDDGSLPASIRPLTDSFIRNKENSCTEE